MKFKPFITTFIFPQTYINNADKQFVASTIQAIGRCASNIPEVTDTCLSGLVKLLSNRDGKLSTSHPGVFCDVAPDNVTCMTSCHRNDHSSYVFI